MGRKKIPDKLSWDCLMQDQATVMGSEDGTDMEKLNLEKGAVTFRKKAGVGVQSINEKSAITE